MNEHYRRGDPETGFAVLIMVLSFLAGVLATVVIGALVGMWLGWFA